MKNIEFSSNIIIENVPVKWLPKIELFYPDLPGFPIMYVHVLYDDNRIYGFPVTLSVKRYHEDNETCDIEFLFLCNENLESIPEYKNVIKKELENRIGISDAITRDLIITSCRDDKYKEFLGKLYDICSNLYGSLLPYGNFLEEIYSIVRFVSAFLPKTGRQSEMRMLYNFLSIFGEKITIDNSKLPQWSFIEYYLLPTLNDVKNNNIELFVNFNKLYKSINKIWKIEYRNIVDVQGVTFKSLENAWDKNKNDLKQNKLLKLENDTSNNFNSSDTYQIERLVDAFNRHPWRACYFIWALCTIQDTNYNEWTKEFFKEFYKKAKNIKGCSEKVVACFLQQGFANCEVIPIDTWIETFHKYALGIDSREELFRSFDNLGKLERLIWLVSQANKTNIKEYMNLLWCQRYGTNGNKTFREINPLSCYECKLYNCCCGYEKIRNQNMLLTRDDIEECKPFALSQNCQFICKLENNIPKKVYKAILKDNLIYDYILIDEFSGYILKEEHSISTESNTVMTVEDFFNLMPKFEYSG